MTFLNDADPQPTMALRAFMEDKIGDLGESWYKRGFNRPRTPRRLRRSPGRTRKKIGWLRGRDSSGATSPLLARQR
jgi:hypothetical protein